MDPFRTAFNERRDSRDLSHDDKGPGDEQRDHERDQPPQTAGPQKTQQFRSRAAARYQVLCRFHDGSLDTIVLPMTSASMPLRRNVARASAGVLTMGSPRRLKEVFSSTGVPVA
jgi:hypothetical protein